MKPLSEDAYRSKKDPSDGETVYEVITAQMQPHWGIAIADIAVSKLHVHERTSEIYVVVEGLIDLTMDGRIVTLARGDVATIAPGTQHMARARTAERARVVVMTLPAWTSADHHVIEVLA